MIAWTQVDFRDLPARAALLFAAAGEASFFARAEWYHLMAQYVCEPPAEVRLYLDNGQQVALVCRTDGAAGLHGLSNAYSVEHGPIMSKAGATPLSAVRHLAAEIAAENPRLETIRFTALDAADEAFAALKEGFHSARWTVRPFFDFGTWFEDTRSLDFQHYFDSRPSALRNTYRRKAKGAGARLDYYFDGETELETLIADYDTVYRQSWKEAEPYPHFMPELMRLAARLGALRMGIVRVDGVPAAAQFWILWRGRAVIYKLAHDQRYDQLSLGTLLTMRLAERVLERDRPAEINFGRGDDPYKRLWLSQRRERWGLLAANPGTWRGFKLGLRGVAARIRDRITS